MCPTPDSCTVPSPGAVHRRIASRVTPGCPPVAHSSARLSPPCHVLPKSVTTCPLVKSVGISPLLSRYVHWFVPCVFEKPVDPTYSVLPPGTAAVVKVPSGDCTVVVPTDFTR